ncbi:MAG: type II toxin-antitoxin system VapC family toxin [Deltaproteobacteria bacterium]|nr:type II toxin-antitoxin system VapC family toxin [Deltaproteobacteria bacterium]
MFLIDSSGWIEFFTDGPLSAQYSKYFKEPTKIITPSIVLYEVYKKIKMERTEEDALLAVSLVNKTLIVPLNDSIALLAADVSLKYSLPMADAIVYATALENNCTVITGDAHFKGLDKVVLVMQSDKR